MRRNSLLTCRMAAYVLLTAAAIPLLTACQSPGRRCRTPEVHSDEPPLVSARFLKGGRSLAWAKEWRLPPDPVRQQWRPAEAGYKTDVRDAVGPLSYESMDGKHLFDNGWVDHDLLFVGTRVCSELRPSSSEDDPIFLVGFRVAKTDDGNITIRHGAPPHDVLVTPGDDEAAAIETASSGLGSVLMAELAKWRDAVPPDELAATHALLRHEELILWSGGSRYDDDVKSAQLAVRKHSVGPITRLRHNLAARYPRLTRASILHLGFWNDTESVPEIVKHFDYATAFVYELDVDHALSYMGPGAVDPLIETMESGTDYRKGNVRSELTRRTGRRLDTAEAYREWWKRNKDRAVELRERPDTWRQPKYWASVGIGDHLSRWWRLAMYPELRPEPDPNETTSVVIDSSGATVQSSNRMQMERTVRDLLK